MFKKWLLSIQAIIFALISLSFIVGNGLYRCLNGVCGLYIGSWHMHDALWHLSLIKLAFNSYPFQHPFMSGQLLTGYNYGLDLVMFAITRLGLDPLFIFFRLMPIMAALLYVYLVIRFVRATYPQSLASQNLLAFFLFFGNSMSYLATLYASHNFDYATLKGFPVVTSLQPVSMFLNLQYAFSLSFFLMLILLMRRSTSWRNNLYLGLVIFILWSLKFYAGAVAMLYLILSSLAHLRQKLPLLGLSLVGTFLAWGIFYRGGGQGIPFAFSPFALSHLMIDDVLLFYNHSLTLARYYLYEHGGLTSPRLWLVELYCVILFILLNFGVRIFGLIGYIFNRRRDLPLIITIIITLSAPLLFVQKGGWYNTMQFLYYGVWLAGISSASWLINIAKVSWRRIAIILFIVLSLPNTLEQISYFSKKQDVIEQRELLAMEALGKLPPGVVHLSQPHKKNGIVPALSGKFPFYLDTDQLMVTGVDYLPRLELIKKYSGGSIMSVPADYYLIYKNDEGSTDSLRNMDLGSFESLYDDELLRLYRRR